ncbi:ABC-F family ATP-binding cassette domain-containing protein [Carnobacterium viridans]|uniref:ATP-binding cassette, subfamily F, member 3 n=1 Tax=Carnobacterium viridans TaxID=174587 RepID=A0A1H0YYI0_9LACT|nr:ABC-F family ATP-binding cassette domain-containing protein [Carnobacterium viridans]UDE94896.1 ABC-F family ATP-binding cassette domain-containing protein [Carnobacterium viridans]SDQ19896.1 ATP-binding cassette, subfamily F, member 3 [Carnobacterium viridans]
MILLQAQHVARYFGADVLFENIYLEIQENSRIALVGRNGTGKSTLLKMIADIEQPDAGKIVKGKQVTIGYLAQNTGLSSEKSMWDEMLTVFEPVIQLEKDMRTIEQQLGDPALLSNEELYQSTLNRYDHLQNRFREENGFSYQAEIRSVLHGFRFYEDDYSKHISQLSGGQKTRLALAKLLLEKKDLLILDEPTNHLDIETLSWLENYLQSYTGALLIVSHDRYFLDKVVNEVYEISRQKISHYKGNYSKYLDLKAAQLEQEWKEFEKQQGEIAKLEDFVSRNLVRTSTTKRAQSRRKQLEKMDRIDKPQGDEKSARFSFKSEKESGNVVLTLANGAIGYEDTILSSPIELDVRKYDSIALVGPNGIGKSTLLKSLIGHLPLIQGEKHLGTNVLLGYYDQEQSDLNSTKSVLAELWDEHLTTPEKDIRSILGSFLFSGADVEKSVSSLSGGEKARLALAKLAMNKDNFLMLDEPTNHLDIDSKEVLENALIDFDGTLLFVSHDRYFINRIATTIIELSENGSTLYLGDYDYYLAKKAEQEEMRLLVETKTAETSKVEPVPTVKGNREINKAEQKTLRQLTRRIETIEVEMDELETIISNCETQLIDPEVFGNHLRVQELNTEINVAQEKLDNLVGEWEEKSLQVEELQ